MFRAVDSGASSKKAGGARYTLSQLLDVIDDSAQGIAFTIEYLLSKTYIKEARFIYHRYKDALKLDEVINKDYLADLAKKAPEALIKE